MISGTISGKFIGSKTFRSIPGLKAWWDSQNGVSLNDSGGVVGWEDLSGSGVLLTPLYNNTMPSIYQDVIDTTSYSGPGKRMRAANVPAAYWNFISNGSPFLTFVILKSNLTSGEGLYLWNNIGATTGGEFYANIGELTTTGFRSMYDGVSTTRILNAYNIEFDNLAEYSTEELFAFEEKSYGYDAGLSGDYQFKAMNQPENAYNFSGSHAIDCDTELRVYCGYGGSSATFKSGVRAILMYDMTGYTRAEIDAYELEIKQLILESYNVTL